MTRRRCAKWSVTPILMLTTETSAERTSAAKQAGATGWIVKPFNPPKLIETIEKLVS